MSKVKGPFVNFYVVIVHSFAQNSCTFHWLIDCFLYFAQTFSAKAGPDCDHISWNRPTLTVISRQFLYFAQTFSFQYFGAVVHNAFIGNRRKFHCSRRKNWWILVLTPLLPSVDCFTLIIFLRPRDSFSTYFFYLTLQRAPKKLYT